MKDMVRVQVRSAKRGYVINGLAASSSVAPMVAQFVGAVATRKPADGAAIVIRAPGSFDVIQNAIAPKRLPRG